MDLLNNENDSARLKIRIEELVESFICKNTTLFAKPIIGYSNGNDSLYSFFKQDIGPFYWTPKDAFLIRYPNEIIDSSDISIISIVLPQTLLTKSMQDSENLYPCENWIDSRIAFNTFNIEMTKYIINKLSESGYKALAPSTMKEWNNRNSEKYSYASNWSERHTAYASGLGTFGLCDGLITSVGKAHRCSSIIVNTKIEPTKREYNKHTDYCLFYTKQGCDSCIARCPANAISAAGHNKAKCRQYTLKVTAPKVKSEYNKDSTACGLCQTKVPCASRIPTNMKRD